MRLLSTLFIAILVAIGSLLSFGAPASANHGGTAPAIFIVPHQDDEVLTYGASIKDHLLAGRNVRMILLTDGSSSSECFYDDADGNQNTGRSGSFGHPNFDMTDGVKSYLDVNGVRIGYSQADRDACRDFRDGEYRAAADAMRASVAGTSGVGTLTDIINSNRMRDGDLTVDFVKSVVESQLATWPHASIKGMTHQESMHSAGHDDHDAIGEGIKAAVYTYNDGTKWNDRRYYVKPILWTTSIPGSYVKQPINDALDAYRSFGQWSVAQEFCEQYGLAKTKTNGDLLDNGKSCGASDQDGGAHSKYHQ